MSKTIQSTPKKDGYRMPAEFDTQERIWMLWPERPDNWRLGAKPAQKTFADVATAISRFEPITVCCSREQFANARALLPEDVRVVEMSYDDAWVRDCGPAFVRNEEGEVRGVHFGFNAWGGHYDGLYFPWDKDQKVSQKIIEIENCDRYDATHFILEGGSFNVDGEGTIITTEQCLLSSGRNPDMTKEEIEENLKEYLGLEKVIWLPRGIDPEETNGHVDDVCCFARPGEVVIAWTDDKTHPYYEIYKEARKVLENTTDAKGRKLKIHTVPCLRPQQFTKEEADGVDKGDAIPRMEGDEYAPSYMNFLIVNGGIICPQFGLDSDKKIIKALSKIFPEREIVGVYTHEIILGGGNIHCITQQVPKK
ncbi:agmatine deiminase [Abyssisolibacter fermentans]|uniref:agmatine deiminase n=1 Tax=Abyssisolibacter fermentans TaxID=1766203 RepID=UPI0008359C49|nr:agmatine deiminase [Abyssisolibacter fermentans]